MKRSRTDLFTYAILLIAQYRFRATSNICLGTEKGSCKAAFFQFKNKMRGGK